MTVTKKLKTLGIASGLALCGIAATVPASAQVSGKVATSSVSRAVLGTTALQTALGQVRTTYAAQLQTAQAKQAELEGLIRGFDTNSDGQIDQAESAALQGAPNFTQIQTLRQEISGIEEQVSAAQVYAVEQVLTQYQAALGEVSTQQQIAMVIDPASLQYAGDGADITGAVTTSLNSKVSQVQIVPPANWRPNPNAVQVMQEINTILRIQQARQEQAQQQQAGNQQAPTGR